MNNNATLSHSPDTNSIVVPTNFSPRMGTEFFEISDSLHLIKMVEIYDNMDQLIFRSEDNKTVKWDGTYAGVEAMEGEYHYTLFLNDDKTKIKGKFRLVR